MIWVQSISIALVSILGSQGTNQQTDYSPLRDSNHRQYRFVGIDGKTGHARLGISKVDNKGSFKGKKVLGAWDLTWAVNGRQLADEPEEYYLLEDRLVWVDAKVAWDLNGNPANASDLFKKPSSIECIGQGDAWNLKGKSIGPWRRFRILLLNGYRIDLVVVKGMGIVERRDYLGSSEKAQRTFVLEKL